MLIFLKKICGEAEIIPAAVPQDGLEAAVRVNENGRFLFLLNHGEKRTEVMAEQKCTDLISGEACEAGESISLEKNDVKILKMEEV